ncbi:hypothetical protein BV898_14207 [Hypsibius exemplaris]|uniref:Triple QxxK/R motif-containing protein n=1 Tax=Hypsibius exemplaris TaxID=2072580 RepID=A0A1W0W8I5_HYPEX|nr:hypothetical protein BV898_14207 [Hypsibius exemplaris]
MVSKDTRSLKATPVEEYRRKIGYHDKKVVQKDVKHQKHKRDNERNFGQSLKDSWKIIATVLGVVVVTSLAVYGALLQANMNSREF